jgi:hypothetical protein
MIKPIMLLCIWGLVFMLAFLGLVRSGPGRGKFSGTIVLDYKPFCQTFVVQTEKGFVILDWEDGPLFFGEGDAVIGPLHTRGIQSIEIVGRGAMTARFEDVFSEFRDAQQRFRNLCAIGPSVPLVGPIL